jgi:hypothetical protein
MLSFFSSANILYFFYPAYALVQNLFCIDSLHGVFSVSEATGKGNLSIPNAWIVFFFLRGILLFGFNNLLSLFPK